MLPDFGICCKELGAQSYELLRTRAPFLLCRTSLLLWKNLKLAQLSCYQWHLSLLFQRSIRPWRIDCFEVCSVPITTLYPIHRKHSYCIKVEMATKFSTGYGEYEQTKCSPAS